MKLQEELGQPTTRVKNILSKLSDLPKEQEIKLKTEQDLKTRIRELESEVRKSPNKAVTKEDIDRFKTQGHQEAERHFKGEHNKTVSEFQREIKDFEIKNKSQFKEYENREKTFRRIIQNITSNLLQFNAKCKKDLNIEMPNIEIPKFEAPKFEKPKLGYNSLNKDTHVYTKTPIHKEAEASVSLDKDQTFSMDDENEEIKLFPAYTRMLKACAMFHPNKITKQKLAVLSDVPIKTSTFKNGLGRLSSLGLIKREGSELIATEKGLEVVGDVEELPTDTDSLLSMWKKRLFPSYYNMLIATVEAYPNSLSKEEISDISGVQLMTSTFKNGLGRLRALGLIAGIGDDIKASEELME